MDIEQPDQLRKYLQRTRRIPPDEEPDIRRLAGGVSNRTMLVVRPSGERWVVKQALEELRVPIRWTCSTERIHVEAIGLQWLQELAPEGMVPDFLFEDRAYDLMAMEAVPEHYRNWKELLLGGEVHEEHIDEFARLLSAIHMRAYRHRDQISADLGDRNYFEPLRLAPYYAYTADRLEGARPFLERLIETTRSRRLTLVHGDFSPKNVLVHKNHLVLLDYEVVHFGDPAFDLGFSLTHLLSKANFVRGKRQTFIGVAEQYWQAYHERVRADDWAEDLEGHVVDHTIACLLARVSGKSQLEYLTDEDKDRQREAALALVDGRPKGVGQLIGAFSDEIQARE